MDNPKEISAEDIRRVMGHVGSIKTEKKSKASSANLEKARQKRWPRKETEK
jgi:hypothetical protein